MSRAILRTSLAASIVLLSSFALAAGAELPERPLSLADCISLAQQHNPSLSIAHEGVMSARAGLRRSLAAYYPSASLQANYGRTGGSSFLDTPTGTIAFSTADTLKESEVFITQTLWRTGRHESMAGAQQAVSAADAGEERAAQDLVLSVSQLYYGALAAEQLVEVTEATLAAARDHEKLVRARAEVGEAPPVDVAPAEANVAAAELALLRAGNDADIAKARLKREMGVPPTYRLRLAQPAAEEREEALPSVEDALEVALESRPELAAIRHSLAASEQNLRLANIFETGFITLSAQYERGITGPREGTSWSAIASFTGFLFDPGERRADVESARAALRSLQAQEQDLVNTVGLEVETALLNAETARQSIEAAAKAVASAAAQLAAAEGKYREGVGIFVEILDAQESVARARTNRVQAIYGYQTALVALKRSMGLLAPTTEAIS
jgi:outer membrane protein